MTEDESLSFRFGTMWHRGTSATKIRRKLAELSKRSAMCEECLLTCARSRRLDRGIWSGLRTRIFLSILF